jgi:hypothetical protein
MIDAGVYLNASYFVREAIRDKLTAIKVIKCREIENAEAIIIQKLRWIPEH